jgi:hypothetical protein
VTGRVLCIHGVAPTIDRERFLHRNLLPSAVLRDVLDNAERFVSIEGALAGHGNALSIDDATRAGADAAMMARNAGHAVTIFVNPGQVESGAPYHFLLLNALLDQVRGDSVELEEVRYPVATNRDRQALRRVLKERLRQLPGEEQRRVEVEELARAWDAGRLGVGKPFTTLTRADLSALVDAGVDLQNHGWTHAFHPALPPDESAEEIRRGREWLHREFGVDARWFAAPFGDSLPHDVAMDCDAWFTFNGEWQEGWLAPRVYNRANLPIPRPQTAQSMLGRVSGAVRGLAARLSGTQRKE